MSLLLASLLLATAFPVLVQDKMPIVRAPIGPASDGLLAAVATDGTNFMVVSGSYAMLVDRDGKPLLPVSVVVPATNTLMPGSSNQPAVASSGNTYLVVAGGGKAALLDRSGTLQKIVDFGGPRTNTEPPPDVAWDGSHYIVVHADPNHQDVYVSTVISDAGEVVGPDTPAAGNRVAARNGVAVIFSGADAIAGEEGFLTLSYSADHRGILGQHLDPSGTPDGDSFVIASGAIGGPPRGAWTGHDYTVTFNDLGSPMLVHVTRAGTAGPPVKLGDFNGYSPDIAWNSNSKLITWTDVKNDSMGTVHAGRVEDDAITTNFTVHRQYDHQSDPHLARTGAGIFAAWREFGFADGVARSAAAATFVNASGSGARIPMPDGWIVATAGGPSSALVVQSNGLNAGLRGTIVTPSGALTPPVVLGEMYGPAAATWTGSAYLATWAEPRVGSGFTIYALRIAANGSVLDPEPLHVMDTAMTRAIAVGSNGRSALIVNDDGGPGALTAALVDGSVKQLDRLTAFAYHNDVDIATDGSSYLVTWRETSTSTIGGRIVGANGELEGDVRDYAHAAAQKLFTFWTGENYLLVWSGYRDLWALRVSADGNPLDSAPHQIGTLDAQVQDVVQFAPSQLAIITTGGTYFVDQRLVLRYAVAPRFRAVVH